jgi:hypothetical protein
MHIKEREREKRVRDSKERRDCATRRKRDDDEMKKTKKKK